MFAFILGKKLVQSQTFTEAALRIATTTLSVKDCYITQLKTPSKDGYFAFQLGMPTRSAQNISKLYTGKTKKAGIETPLNFFAEVRLNDKLNPELVKEGDKDAIKVGETVFSLGMKLSPVAVFKKGDIVQVTGTSKGKGFAGVMKRHGFAGGPATHGQSDRARSPGSIGSRTIPGRVFKGKNMAGRMGSDTITVQGLEVLEALEDKLVLRGLVPGSINSVLLVKTQTRNG